MRKIDGAVHGDTSGLHGGRIDVVIVLDEIVLFQIQLQNGVLDGRKHEPDVLRVCRSYTQPTITLPVLLLLAWFAGQAVVKVVGLMCSRGGAEPLRSRRTKISIQCCTQKLHFKLTAPVHPAPGVE